MIWLPKKWHPRNNYLPTKKNHGGPYNFIIYKQKQYIDIFYYIFS